MMAARVNFSRRERFRPPMFAQSIPEKISTLSDSLSLKDLLDEQCAANLSEYLSLSVTRMDEDTRISFTTTGNEPVTYATVISAVSAVDLQSLVFMIQNDRRCI